MVSTILIVDDDPQTRQLYLALLGPLGHEVMQASDGEEGLSLVANRRPDLVISDVLMPNLNGYEFVSRLHQLPQFETVPVIFQSAGLLDDQVRALAASCEVTDFLAKPCEAEDILEIVTRVLRRSCQLPAPLLVPEAAQEPVPLLLDAVYEKTKQLEEANRTLEEHLRELTASNKELEAFTYTVAHDLRAPVRHITAFAGVLQRGFSERLDSDGRYLLEKILKASQKMGLLIDNLLDFSRLANVTLRTDWIDVGELVNEIRQELEPELQGRDIRWEIRELPEVEADRSLLQEALGNLVANAVKYTSKQERARIEIGAFEEPDKGVTIFIRDNGAGFRMDWAGKLFRVFERLHPAEDFEGTGIGLAIVKRIAEHHGGRVWAEGSPGEGATFFFSLPGRG